MLDVFLSPSERSVNSESSTEMLYKRVSRPELEEMANKGDAEAQFNLFHIYSHSKKGEKMKEANEMLVKSAENGYQKALFLYGKFLVQGINFPKNIDKGIEQINKSSEKGNVKAALFLAHAYEKGQFVQADCSKAVYYYKIASSLESSSANNALGSFYQKGVMGLDKDIDMAIHYYSLSSSEGNSIAKFNLSILLKEKGETEKSDKLLKEAADEGVPQAQFNYALRLDPHKEREKYTELMRSAANKGLPRACFSYALILKHDGNEEESIKYLKKAATAGHAKSQYLYAKAMKDKDPVLCRKFLEASQNQIPDAKVLLEEMIQKANGNDPDSLYYQYLASSENNKEKAIELLKQAADGNQREALLKLSEEYSTGINVEKDYGKSNAILQELVNNGDSSAECNLGRAYELGQGFPVDLKKAEELYHSSYLHGCEAGGLNYAHLLKRTNRQKEAAKVYSDLYQQHNTTQVEYYYAKSLLNSSSKEDNETAIRFLEKLSDQGYLKAMHDYGFALLHGTNVTKDINRAITLIKESAAQGNISSKFAISQFMMEGYHMKEDIVGGVQLLKECSRENYYPAIVKEAELSVKNDPERAKELIKKAESIPYISNQYSECTKTLEQIKNSLN